MPRLTASLVCSRDRTDVDKLDRGELTYGFGVRVFSVKNLRLHNLFLMVSHEGLSPKKHQVPFDATTTMLAEEQMISRSRVW